MADVIGAVIDKVLTEEGDEFMDDPNDAGGPTRWGVTQATLSDYRGKPVSVADVQALTRSEAWSVLYTKFVRAPKFDQVAKLSIAIAEKLVDAGVNLGPPTVTRFLQRALNAFNLLGKRYPDVSLDCTMGPSTLAALSAYLAWRKSEGEAVLCKTLDCLQCEHYIEEAEKRPSDEEFVYGWIRARV